MAIPQDVKEVLEQFMDAKDAFDKPQTEQGIDANITHLQAQISAYQEMLDCLGRLPKTDMSDPMIRNLLTDAVSQTQVAAKKLSNTPLQTIEFAGYKADEHNRLAIVQDDLRKLEEFQAAFPQAKDAAKMSQPIKLLNELGRYQAHADRQALDQNLKTFFSHKGDSVPDIAMREEALLRAEDCMARLKDGAPTLVTEAHEKRLQQARDQMEAGKDVAHKAEQDLQGFIDRAAHAQGLDKPTRPEPATRRGHHQRAEGEAPSRKGPRAH